MKEVVTSILSGWLDAWTRGMDVDAAGSLTAPAGFNAKAISSANKR